MKGLACRAIYKRHIILQLQNGDSTPGIYLNLPPGYRDYRGIVKWLYRDSGKGMELIQSLWFQDILPQ